MFVLANLSLSLYSMKSLQPVLRTESHAAAQRLALHRKTMPSQQCCWHCPWRPVPPVVEVKRLTKDTVYPHEFHKRLPKSECMTWHGMASPALDFACPVKTAFLLLQRGTSLFTKGHLALHYITLHYITLHCIALPCIIFHCIALH